MTQVYSKCTVCYEELNEADQELNLLAENENFPVCEKCLNEAAKEIHDILKASPNK